MKGLPSTVLALLFAFFSLIALLTTPHDSDSRIAGLSEGSARVSAIGLTVMFPR